MKMSIEGGLRDTIIAIIACVVVYGTFFYLFLSFVAFVIGSYQ